MMNSFVIYIDSKAMIGDPAYSNENDQILYIIKYINRPTKKTQNTETWNRLTYLDVGWGDKKR